LVYSTISSLDGRTSDEARDITWGEPDPADLLELKESEGQTLSIGGPGLAGQALAAGLVDEVHLFVSPVTLGSGTRALPEHFRCNLELLGVDRFASGFVHLRYRIRG
jgi:dihydrofolate reductase